jgi:hypothetical protein
VYSHARTALKAGSDDNATKSVDNAPVDRNR